MKTSEIEGEVLQLLPRAVFDLLAIWISDRWSKSPPGRAGDC